VIPISMPQTCRSKLARQTAAIRVDLVPATSGRPRPTALGRSVPRGRCERRAAHSLSPQGEVNPTSTDAIVGSMKAPVRVADVDVGRCRRGALRSGEQRLAFDAGEELGGSDFEF